MLRMILVSLARANERVHVHNKRNFPQAKHDSEINARFLSNEHGDLYCYIMIVYIITCLIKHVLKKKELSEGKKT